MKGVSMMQSYHLRWFHKNRVWVFNDGPLEGEPLFYGFDIVIDNLLKKLGAVKRMRALNNGCNLILSERYLPDAYKFNLESKDGTGGRYHHDELGNGWIECDYLIGCHDPMYINVEVK
tara:strand:- start:1882 stop:2235 length:354 start_codon:yes stop_codon:yes gene_type:complete